MFMHTDQSDRNAIRNRLISGNPLLGLLLIVLVIIVLLLSGSTRAVALAKIKP